MHRRRLNGRVIGDRSMSEAVPTGDRRLRVVRCPASAPEGRFMDAALQTLTGAVASARRLPGARLPGRHPFPLHHHRRSPPASPHRRKRDRSGVGDKRGFPVGDPHRAQQTSVMRAAHRVLGTGPTTSTRTTTTFSDG